LSTTVIFLGRLFVSRKFQPHEFCYLRDKALTLRAPKRTNLVDEVIVVRDRVEASGHPMGTGVFGVRQTNITTEVILPDFKLPRLDSLGSLRLIRRKERRKLFSTSILASSIEERNRIESHRLATNRFAREPVDLTQFVDAARRLGLYWLVLNEPPPARRR